MGRHEIAVEHWPGGLPCPVERVKLEFQDYLQHFANNGWTVRATVSANDVDPRLQGLFVILARKVKGQPGHGEGCNCWPCRAARGAKEPV